MNYYPACLRPDLVLGISPHSDGSALTLLLQDDEITALQIKHKESWVNVKPIPNSLVVNIGDATEVFTIFHKVHFLKVSSELQFSIWSDSGQWGLQKH